MSNLRPYLLTACLFCLISNCVWADVVPGDIIDRSNFQKIEGLVPDYISTWVKNGDLTMRIGKLKCNPREFWPQVVKDNWQSNIGRYKIDQFNGIVDAETGSPVRKIKGLPFPEPDIKDPGMPVMLMWNEIFREYYIKGNTLNSLCWLSVNRKGLEKKILLESYMVPADQEKSMYDYIQLSVFKEPFSLAGTGTLVHYRLHPRDEGLRFIYTPELRKIRRMSHRLAGSDVLFGMDSAPDDFWAGGPRDAIEQGVYRFIEEKDALVPYVSDEPEKLVRTSDGSLQGGYSVSGRKLIMGFEDPAWKGAPWHLTNLIWVTSRVYVIESRSTNPNYNYGPCEGWVEKGTFIPSYKRFTDINGNLWKGHYFCGVPLQTENGSYRIIYKYGIVIVDMRRDHGSAFPDIFDKGGYCFYEKANINKRMFTRAAFEKFTK